MKVSSVKRWIIGLVTAVVIANSVFFSLAASALNVLGINFPDYYDAEKYAKAVSLFSAVAGCFEKYRGSIHSDFTPLVALVDHLHYDNNDVKNGKIIQEVWGQNNSTAPHPWVEALMKVPEGRVCMGGQGSGSPKNSEKLFNTVVKELGFDSIMDIMCPDANNGILKPGSGVCDRSNSNYKLRSDYQDKLMLLFAKQLNPSNPASVIPLLSSDAVMYYMAYNNYFVPGTECTSGKKKHYEVASNPNPAIDTPFTVGFNGDGSAKITYYYEVEGESASNLWHAIPVLGTIINVGINATRFLDGLSCSSAVKYVRPDKPSAIAAQRLIQRKFIDGCREQSIAEGNDAMVNDGTFVEWKDQTVGSLSCVGALSYIPDEPTGPINETRCKGGIAGWIFCPVAEGGFWLVNALMNLIKGGLSFNILSGKEGDNIRNVWGSFLGLANLAFVIVFLIIIYSSATSVGLKNYDLKKILPRLVIAAILVNTSFWICAAASDIANIVGMNIKDFIVNSFAPTTSTGSENFAKDVLMTALLGGGIVILLFVGGFAVVALGFLLILALLSFRQILLVALIVISPLAFVAWLLPNTEKWFKKWWQNYIKMLLIYPMIMGVWGLSRVLESLTDYARGDGNILDNFFGFVAWIMVQVAPAVAIIPIFKMGGDLMGKVQGLANKGINAAGGNALKTADKNRAKRKQEQAKAGNLQFGSNRFASTRFGRGFNSAINAPGQMLSRRAKTRAQNEQVFKDRQDENYMNYVSGGLRTRKEYDLLTGEEHDVTEINRRAGLTQRRAAESHLAAATVKKNLESVQADVEGKINLSTAEASREVEKKKREWSETLRLTPAFIEMSKEKLAAEEGKYGSKYVEAERMLGSAAGDVERAQAALDRYTGADPGERARLTEVLDRAKQVSGIARDRFSAQQKALEGSSTSEILESWKFDGKNAESKDLARMFKMGFVDVDDQYDSTTGTWSKRRINVSDMDRYQIRGLTRHLLNNGGSSDKEYMSTFVDDYINKIESFGGYAGFDRDLARNDAQSLVGDAKNANFAISGATVPTVGRGRGDLTRTARTINDAYFDTVAFRAKNEQESGESNADYNRRIAAEIEAKKVAAVYNARNIADGNTGDLLTAGSKRQGQQAISMKAMLDAIGRNDEAGLLGMLGIDSTSTNPSVVAEIGRFRAGGATLADRFGKTKYARNIAKAVASWSDQSNAQTLSPLIANDAGREVWAQMQNMSRFVPPPTP